MPLTRSLLLSVVVTLVSAGPQFQRPSDEAQKAVGEAFKLQADGKYLAAGSDVLTEVLTGTSTMTRIS